MTPLHSSETASSPPTTRTPSSTNAISSSKSRTPASSAKNASSSSSASTSTSGTKTPGSSRYGSSLANPHTPIASIKRNVSSSHKSSASKSVSSASKSKSKSVSKSKDGTGHSRRSIGNNSNHSSNGGSTSHLNDIHEEQNYYHKKESSVNNGTAKRSLSLSSKVMTPVRKIQLNTPDGKNKSSSNKRSEAMSPMHPVKPVLDRHGHNNENDNCLSNNNNEDKKGTAADSDVSEANEKNGVLSSIFSPVLNFLNQKNDDDGDNAQNHAVDSGAGEVQEAIEAVANTSTDATNVSINVNGTAAGSDTFSDPSDNDRLNTSNYEVEEDHRDYQKNANNGTERERTGTDETPNTTTEYGYQQEAQSKVSNAHVTVNARSYGHGQYRYDDDGDITMDAGEEQYRHNQYQQQQYDQYQEQQRQQQYEQYQHQQSQQQQHTQQQQQHQQPAEESDDDDEDHEEEFNPYLFIKYLPQYNSVVPYPDAKICLPPKDPTDPPISLVLDLDETLVHCTVEPIPDADMTFPVFFNGIQYRVHVRTRPYLKEFLEAVRGRFEVTVFTASQEVYASELLDRIDPDGKYIKHRMFRESCLLVEGNYLKDLNVLGRDLSQSVLVDNSPHAFGYQVDNGIPIESWFDDPNDTELLKLEQFLNTLHGVKDVRSMVRSKFQTYKLIRDAM
mmetsp:Transcript_1931/g.2613  ORF Transcript_1931/g.2613 Transcript_1931/m.2613 type:complete len:672 (+) Transcript_1931:522-2537(+)|eukprot:CAMPEP_0194075252 /NCGR_PEP_ID=MMETSP0149-20130528/2275_1 /TAXON_ID=122233 /ORGANISM="Chaetoceros debilis, Strain MM31A-1" /LENGTH=671 /DNA_ID=CAMNT_0038755669 /DNA_START=477 /DNA_END=2492 /DNA_ORIENTATION=+